MIASLHREFTMPEPRDYSVTVTATDTTEANGSASFT